MLQVLINGLISGLLLALVALGFNIIFSTTKVFHIAHGAICVSGVYSFIYLQKNLLTILPDTIFSISILIVLAIFLTAFLALLVEYLVYKPLLKKSSNPNITLISSLAVYTFLVNVIAMLFGNETQMLTNKLFDSYQYKDLLITEAQLLQIIVSICVIFVFLLFINKTGIGLKIRAVSTNPALAGVVGIKIAKIRYIVLAVGSILALCAIFLKAYDVGIDPYSGMTITLSAAVTVIIGGADSLKGTLIASFLLAVLQNYTEWFLSAQWRDVITFALLIVILLWRTEGILQFNIRSDNK